MKYVNDTDYSIYYINYYCIYISIYIILPLFNCIMLIKMPINYSYIKRVCCFCYVNSKCVLNEKILCFEGDEGSKIVCVIMSLNKTQK